MKWLTAARAAQAVHGLATAAIVVLLLLGEPECAAALARVGLLPAGPVPGVPGL